MKTEILSDNCLSDGDTKLRPIACELNPLTRPDGSALFSQGSTCVLASTSGPVEATKRMHFKLDRAHIHCIYRPKAGLPTIHDKLRQTIIRDTCESALLTTQFPRTTISVQVQELDNRCGLNACAINATCMALMISGLPMAFTYAAVHCIVDRNDELVLDPDHVQAVGQLADFTFVFDSLERKLVTVHTGGCFTMAQFNDAEFMCRIASDIIFKFYYKIIHKFHNKDLPNTDNGNDSDKDKENDKIKMEES